MPLIRCDLARLNMKKPLNSAAGGGVWNGGQPIMSFAPEKTTTCLY